MEIPAISDKIWSDLLVGKINSQMSFLALKILLSRLRLNLKDNSSKETIEQYSKELYEFFLRWQNVPSAKKDLEKLLQERSF